WWQNFWDGGSTQSAAQNLKVAQRKVRKPAVISDYVDPELVTWNSTELVSLETIDALESSVQYYKKIVVKGGWPLVPKGKSLRQGTIDERVGILRRRLVFEGDLPKKLWKGIRFDRNVEEAVKRFQKRHGLQPSGIVRIRTLRTMNIPAEIRLQQLRINLARLRQRITEERGSKYIVVNIPAYQLQAVRNGNVELYSRVIVGKRQRQTPAITAKIRALNFLPYWRVPDSISSRDIIPLLRKDPGYLSREHLRVLKTWGGEEVDPTGIDWNSEIVNSYKFRQDPGTFNALGIVRLDMPNEHIVYLHDTPLKKLFGQTHRAFSAGCVRVHRIRDLASWLLMDVDSSWTRDKVDAVSVMGESLDVDLEQKVPVLFVYQTAWATEDGRTHFRADIYGRDGVGNATSSNAEQAVKKTLTP
ncbi:MAG: L,D-transpeptidase family protein, partial [Desulfobulbia bacterium]